MPLKFRPNLEKIVELMLYLAEHKPGADKYQAVKLFYLADKEHLNRHGRPITQERYCAMDYGPVASTVLDIFNRNDNTIRRLRSAGVDHLPFELRQSPWKRGKDGQPIVVIDTPEREVDVSLFSKSDLKVFDETLKKYGAYSFDDFYNLTHEHPAYLNAWRARGSAKAHDMSYEDMIDSDELRKKIVRDIGPVASFFK